MNTSDINAVKGKGNFKIDPSDVMQTVVPAE
jgi:hypothetical protein